MEPSTTTLTNLKERYLSVCARVAAAAQLSGRTGRDVMLVAVTKFAEPDQIRELMRLGHRDFGENRVQQLVQRATIIDEWLQRHRTMTQTAGALSGGDDLLGSAEDHQPQPGTTAGSPHAPRWHMLGHLQRNKARKVIETCRLIHSVDNLRVAEEIQTVAVKRDTPVDVLLQVNCSGERQKFGCAVPAAIHLAEQIETMLHVRLRGIMTMAAQSDNPADSRPAFGRLRELFEEIRDSGTVSPHFNILSMGMSNDFEVAIQEGANLVRVGSAIFGTPAGDHSGEGAAEGSGEGTDSESSHGSDSDEE